MNINKMCIDKSGANRAQSALHAGQMETHQIRSVCISLARRKTISFDDVHQTQLKLIGSTLQTQCERREREVNTTNNTNRNVVQFEEKNTLNYIGLLFKSDCTESARPGCVCMHVRLIRMYLACKFNH